jgi:uncharacterized metal-binding protein YceD (DUF177 family)
MIKKNTFDIPFSGLKLGSHSFNFQIKDSFFEHFDIEQMNNIDININVNLEKKENMLVLDFNLNGNLNLLCDLCTDSFSQNINNKFDLIVRFSDEIFEQDNEEILILPTNEHTLFLDDYFHEFIILSLPNKRVHLEIEECNQEMIKRIEKMTFMSKKEDSIKKIDPRWAGLKNLKTK